MDSGLEATAYLTVGLLVVGASATLFTPANERLILTTVVIEEKPPPGATVHDHSELPQSSQAVVTETIREGSTTLSTYDDHEAVETLRGERYVRKGGVVYFIRTTSADGGGAFLEGILRDSGLAVGGLLVGTAAYLRFRSGPSMALVAFPVVATVAVVGANTLAAPAVSLVSWFGNASFGIAAGVPVLAGISIRRRDRRAGAITAATLLLSVAVLLAGRALSGLYLLIPLCALGIPGTAFGWRVGGRRSHES